MDPHAAWWKFFWLTTFFVIVSLIPRIPGFDRATRVSVYVSGTLFPWIVYLECSAAIVRNTGMNIALLWYEALIIWTEVIVAFVLIFIGLANLPTREELEKMREMGEDI